MENKPTGLRVEFYEDVAGRTRWTQYNTNGKVVAASKRGFSDRNAALWNYSGGTRDALIISQTYKLFFRHGPGEYEEIVLDKLI